MPDARHLQPAPRPWALLITPICPNPNGLGLSRRAWSWVAELSQEYELLTIIVPIVSNAACRPVSLPGRVAYLPARRSGRTGDVWIEPHAGMETEINTLLPNTEPARAIVFRLYIHRIAELLPASWRRRVEIDFDDLESRSRWSQAGLALRQRRLGEAVSQLSDALWYRRQERAAMATYERVHLAAGEDVAAVRSWSRGAEIVFSPNRIAPREAVVPEPAANGAPTVLFVGALGYPPNEDAVLWFARDVLPFLRRRVPNVRLVIAGASPRQRVLDLRQDGVIVQADPPDLAPIYAEATVVIAPLRGGSGTKLKILEAWQYGRPVVATPHAARGLSVRNGGELLTAGRARAFARACERLLQDKGLAAAVAGAARIKLNDYLCPPVALNGLRVPRSYRPGRVVTAAAVSTPDLGRPAVMKISITDADRALLRRELKRARDVAVTTEAARQAALAQLKFAKDDLEWSRRMATPAMVVLKPLETALLTSIDHAPGAVRRSFEAGRFMWISTFWRKAFTSAPDVQAVQRSDYFDAEWYRATYPGIPNARDLAALHYVHFRPEELRNPGPKFDAKWYVARYPSAQATPPLVHYELHGKSGIFYTSADAEATALAERAHLLGSGRSASPPRIAIGLGSESGGFVATRAINSSLIALRAAGLLGCGGVLIQDAAPANERAGVRRLKPLNPGSSIGALHNALMQAAVESGASLYVAADLRGVFDPGAIDALIRMSEAAGHQAIIAATDFPDERPDACDEQNFDLIWMGSACVLIPLALMPVLGAFETDLGAFTLADFLWRAKASGVAVKLCPAACFLAPGDARLPNDWADTRTLLDAYRLAVRWGKTEIGTEIARRLMRAGASPPSIAPGSQRSRRPEVADFARGLGYSQAWI